MQDQSLQSDPQTDPQEGTLSVPSDTGRPRTIQDSLSIGLIAVGSVMMIIVIARMLRNQSRNRRAHANAPRHPRPVPARSSGSTATQDRLERLMADGEELTRRLAAILDNKAARLEILIEQADQRVQELQAAAEAVQAQPQAASPRSAGLALTEAGPPAAEPIDPLHRKVYDLADQGLPPVDIARQIDRPTGQVELILALRRA